MLQDADDVLQETAPPLVCDRDLLDRFVGSGDDEAFRAILQRHEGWVRHHCQLRLGRGQDADDATQAVFVLLARKASAIRDGGALAAWLQRAVHGITSNMRAATAARRRHEREAGTGAFQRGDTEPEGAEDEDLIRAQAHLPDCLHALHPADREVVVRYFLNCQKLTEIAGELGCSAGAVQKRVARAIARLQGLMRRHGVVATPALLMAIASPGRAAPPPDLVEATAQAVLHDSMTPQVADLVRRGLPSSARTLTATGLVIGATVLALLAVAVRPGAVEPAGPRLLSVSGAMEAIDATGAPLALPAGTHLPPSVTLVSGADGDLVVALADGGTLTLREEGRLTLAQGRWSLHCGAVVATSGAAPFDLALPHGPVRIAGTAWAMAQPDFDRIETVTGEARVADAALVLPPGKALLRGAGCPAEPVATPGQELSPRFGGVFTRAAAEAYARGRRLLDGGPPAWRVGTVAPLAEMATRWRGPLDLRPTAQGLEVRSRPGLGTQCFGIVDPAWPPAGVAVVRVRLQVIASTETITFQDGSQTQPYAEMSWAGDSSGRSRHPVVQSLRCFG